MRLSHHQEAVQACGCEVLSSLALQASGNACIACVREAVHLAAAVLVVAGRFLGAALDTPTSSVLRACCYDPALRFEAAARPSCGARRNS